MKILVSDVNSSHAEEMKNVILEECPDAEVIIRIESLMDSVNWAIANGVDLINRSTTGLSEYRLENEGKLASDHKIGIIHAHGSNEHIKTPPAIFGPICAVGYGDQNGNKGSYSDGLDFYYDETNQSRATARITGIIGQLLINHPDWNFHCARQALRQTASGWATGHTTEEGFGLVDKTAVFNLDTADLGLIGYEEYERVHHGTRIELSVYLLPQWADSELVAAFFPQPPERNRVPGEAEIFYRGTDEQIVFHAPQGGTFYFAFYQFYNGNYSLVETTSIRAFTFENQQEESVMAKLYATDLQFVRAGGNLNEAPILKLTQEGAVVKIEENTLEELCSESDSPADVILTGRKFEIRAVLCDDSLENMGIALNAGDGGQVE